ncbi:Predicted arabinose efflux permease, MFS family [Psychrobacillus psychrotolerans]|uniref:Predicted arabinose efflux permease, MFS family n=1 Tax=Psychrobacillus psychrotolerans TaxID=126156 RepID=A0A1I5XT86_9BACI|nr:MFS transporter [Psychrobacillus psychrotolerans]SFQ35148.1 Predicted arabinose efflux permease, MFS family [Psychrobacillus psychrotolerans]
MNKEKLWTKDFIIVSTINFLATLVYFLLLVTIASYAKSEFEASTSTAGLVSSIFIIGSLIGRLGAGRFIGIKGPTNILWVGLSFFTITSLFYFLANSIPLLLVNRLAQGVAVGIIGTATGTIVAHILPRARKGEGIGYFSLSAVLATAIGPFIGILLLKMENGFTIMFTMNLALSILCILFLAAVKLKLAPIKQPEKTEVKSSILSQFIEPKAVPISFVALIIGFSYSGVMTFLSFYAESINLVSVASYFFLVYAIVIIISRPFTGKLMDTKGANIIVYPCIVLFAIGMLLFSQASAGWMLLLAAAFIGIGYGNFNSVAQTIAVKVTEPHRFGLATATYFILFDIGLGVGPYILGFIVPNTGYRTIFVAMVAVIVICIPVYYLLHGRKDRELMKIV